MGIEGLWYRSESVVFQSVKKSASMRTTVPHQVADFMQLQPGDRLEWLLNFKDNRITVVLRKKSTDKLTAK